MDFLQPFITYISDPKKNRFRKLFLCGVASVAIWLAGDITGFTKFHFLSQKLATAGKLSEMSKDTTYTIETRRELREQAERLIRERTIIEKTQLYLQGLSASKLFKENTEGGVASGRAKTLDGNFWLVQFLFSGFFYLGASLLILIERERIVVNSIVGEIILRLMFSFCFLLIAVFSSVTCFAVFSFIDNIFVIPFLSFVLNLAAILVGLRYLKKKNIRSLGDYLTRTE